MHKDDEAILKSVGKWALRCVMAAAVLFAAGLYGCPHYEVYQQGLKGEAELKRAEQNRKVKVYEAEAAMESAKLHAQAEIERAKGVAEANKIIADGLKDHDEYLRYLWIDKVAASANKEVIYVPTEASLPILEAGRGKQ